MIIKDKCVVITGAGRGLGKAMAILLSAKAPNLCLVDVDEAAAKATAAECEGNGAKAIGVRADVTNEDDVVALFNRAKEAFGSIDALINNAGILRDGLLIKARDGEVISRMSLQDWQQVIDVNLTGVFLCGREAATHMIASGQGGVIINISSISSAGNAGQSNYAAAKAGVSALTVTWAKELARYGIRVADIAPGFTDTEMVAAMPPQAREKVTAMIPVRRLARPEEIAHTAAYILENDYVNGRSLAVDGGLRL